MCEVRRGKSLFVEFACDANGLPRVLSGTFERLPWSDTI